ncbi:MAG TPA: bacillithiol biosynthesis BshC, partial [Polyangiaceae bacterium]|nr:bacillithiol biosynthesis BshC [Polyangiaceae bacterium]
MVGAPPLPAVSRAFAEALSAKQRALGAGPRAEANALALASGALVVATGQQPGLFGGPLLAAHKAMGAVALAHAEAARLGRPVVPVFWVASEDHDAVEVDRAVVMDVAGAPRAISLGLVPDGRSVRDLPLEPA